MSLSRAFGFVQSLVPGSSIPYYFTVTQISSSSKKCVYVDNIIKADVTLYSWICSACQVETDYTLNLVNDATKEVVKSQIERIDSKTRRFKFNVSRAGRYQYKVSLNGPLKPYNNIGYYEHITYAPISEVFSSISINGKYSGDIQLMAGDTLEIKPKLVNIFNRPYHCETSFTLNIDVDDKTTTIIAPHHNAEQSKVKVKRAGMYNITATIICKHQELAHWQLMNATIEPGPLDSLQIQDYSLLRCNYPYTRDQCPISTGVSFVGYETRIPIQHGLDEWSNTIPIESVIDDIIVNPEIQAECLQCMILKDSKHILFQTENLGQCDLSLKSIPKGKQLGYRGVVNSILDDTKTKLQINTEAVPSLPGFPTCYLSDSNGCKVNPDKVTAGDEVHVSLQMLNIFKEKSCDSSNFTIDGHSIKILEKTSHVDDGQVEFKVIPLITGNIKLMVKIDGYKTMFRRLFGDYCPGYITENLINEISLHVVPGNISYIEFEPDAVSSKDSVSVVHSWNEGVINTPIELQLEGCYDKCGNAVMSSINMSCDVLPEKSGSRKGLIKVTVHMNKSYTVNCESDEERSNILVLKIHETGLYKIEFQRDGEILGTNHPGWIQIKNPELSTENSYTENITDTEGIINAICVIACEFSDLFGKKVVGSQVETSKLSIKYKEWQSFTEHGFTGNTNSHIVWKTLQQYDVSLGKDRKFRATFKPQSGGKYYIFYDDKIIQYKSHAQVLLVKGLDHFEATGQQCTLTSNYNGTEFEIQCKKNQGFKEKKQIIGGDHANSNNIERCTGVYIEDENIVDNGGYISVSFVSNREYPVSKRKANEVMSLYKLILEGKHYRHWAGYHEDKRIEFKEKSQEAHFKTDYIRSQRYKALKESHAEMMMRAHNRARDVIFQFYNQNREDQTIDLHELRAYQDATNYVPGEAVELLEERLNKVKGGDYDWLEIIVGAGHHSKHSKQQQVRKVVEKYLQRKDLQLPSPPYHVINKGSLLVQFREYSGREPSYGQFYCSRCNKVWWSKASWKGYRQTCYTCKCTKSLPYKQTQLRGSAVTRRRTGSGGAPPEHTIEHCEKCQELGRRCMSKFRTY